MVSDARTNQRERLVALEGALNWRDLGGYPTADGRVTKWDRIYRSDGLDQLTDADLDVIAELGIKLVIDFRVDREVDENPSRLADHPELRCQRLPIGGDEVEGKSILDVIRAGELKTYTIDDMAATYERLLEDFAPTFGEVIEHAADLEQLIASACRSAPSFLPRFRAPALLHGGATPRTASCSSGGIWITRSTAPHFSCSARLEFSSVN